MRDIELFAYAWIWDSSKLTLLKKLIYLCNSRNSDTNRRLKWLETIGFEGVGNGRKIYFIYESREQVNEMLCKR